MTLRHLLGKDQGPIYAAEGADRETVDLGLLDEVLAAVPDFVWAVDLRGRFTYVSPAVEPMLGYTVEECMALRGMDLLVPEDRERARAQTEETLAAEERQRGSVGPKTVEYIHRRKDGTTLWAEISLNLLRDAEGRAIGILGVTRDITRWKQAETARLRARRDLEQSKQDLERLVHAIPTGVMLIDRRSRVVLDVNQAASDLLDRPPKEIIGSVCHSFIWPAERGGCPVADLGHDLESSERLALRPDGTKVPVLKTVVPIEAGGRSCLLEAFTDISGQKEVQAALAEMSRTDGLTGLANRRAFDERFDAEWRRAMRGSDPLILLMCDIDHFKQYNDEHGHMQGDDCVKRVADVLQRSHQRVTDCVARWGGEEFAVLIAGAGADDAPAAAERIRRAIEDARIPRHADRPGVVTLSVGAATAWPGKSLEPQSLHRAADDALYRSKAGGRNRTTVVCLPRGD